MKINIGILLCLLLYVKGIKREVHIVKLESRNENMISFDKQPNGEYKIEIKQWIAEEYHHSLTIETRFGSDLTGRYNEQRGSFCNEDNSTDIGMFASIVRKTMGILPCPVEPGNYTGPGYFIFDGNIDGGKENEGALDASILNLYIEAIKTVNDLDVFGIIYRLF